MIVTVLLIVAIAPIATTATVLGALWVWGVIDKVTATCVCGAFLHRGLCTHPFNHLPYDEWVLSFPPPPPPISSTVHAGQASYEKAKEMLALPRGDR